MKLGLLCEHAQLFHVLIQEYRNNTTPAFTGANMPNQLHLAFIS